MILYFYKKSDLTLGTTLVYLHVKRESLMNYSRKVNSWMNYFSKEGKLKYKV